MFPANYFYVHFGILPKKRQDLKKKQK